MVRNSPREDSDEQDSTKGMSVTRTNVEEVVDMLANAESVVIVPGYGMSTPTGQTDDRYGCRESAIRDFRNDSSLESEKYRLQVRCPPCSWTYAWAMQRPPG